VWPLGTHVDLPSHKTFEDRVEASKLLIKAYGLKVPVIYDTMKDKFDEAFAVWPERYYIIIQDGDGPHMGWIFYPNVEVGYDRARIEEVLEAVSSGQDITQTSQDNDYKCHLDIEDVLQIKLTMAQRSQK